VVADPRDVRFEVTGAKGDRLVWIDATREIGSTLLADDDWQHDMPMSTAKDFIRAEIVAEASRDRLDAELRALIDGRELPWQLRDVDPADQPIRRALGNPIYIGA